MEGTETLALRGEEEMRPLTVQGRNLGAETGRDLPPSGVSRQQTVNPGLIPVTHFPRAGSRGHGGRVCVCAQTSPSRTSHVPPSGRGLLGPSPWPSRLPPEEPRWRCRAPYLRDMFWKCIRVLVASSSLGCPAWIGVSPGLVGEGVLFERPCPLYPLTPPLLCPSANIP